MATTSRAGKQKGSAHPNVEAAVRGWQTHEYANAGAAADAPERGNNHLYEEMYPGDDAKTARRKYHRLINAQVRKPEVSRSEKPEAGKRRRPRLRGAVATDVAARGAEDDATGG